ncbi:alpha/beta hydrolase family protein [Spongiibacter sp.]|uniref:alpha/beta hydrolase family protein n=1 Tax=Spongiibacter sp. TaxID=2024860 RepID=UPI0035629B1B
MNYLQLGTAAAALALAACGNSSSSNISSSGSSDIVTESFTTESQHLVTPLDVNPACVPDADSNLPLPEGLLVYKKGEQPTRLVVFSHGIGHSVRSSWLPHMRRELRLAQSLENTPGNVAFVATDYRDNFGFPTLRGAYDTIAATEYALQAFPSIDTVYLFGVSMGGAVSGTAIVESAAISEDGSALYDYWIDVEGVSQLAETYSEAKAAAEATGNATAMAAASGIERDTGGTPVECPLAYQRRSPALHAAQMQLGGIKAATVIHPLNDGLVPYNQGREMAGALTTAGIPTQFFTVLGVSEWQNPGTTATGTLGAGDADSSLNLAGHGSEADANHPVMRAAFEQLRKMLDGSYNETAPYFECIVDHRAPEESCQVDQFQP